MRAYRRDFDEAKHLIFWIFRKNILKFRIKSTITSKKKIDSEPVYKEKYLETKIRPYNEKINTNFDNNKMIKEGSQCSCLSVILIDSVFRTGKNF